MQEARQRRQRRAVDLGFKKKYLPEVSWEDPWREYHEVEHVLARTQAEQDERAHLSDELWFAELGPERWFEYDTKGAYWWEGAVDGKPELSVAQISSEKQAQIST